MNNRPIIEQVESVRRMRALTEKSCLDLTLSLTCDQMRQLMVDTMAYRSQTPDDCVKAKILDFALIGICNAVDRIRESDLLTAKKTKPRMDANERE